MIMEVRAIWSLAPGTDVHRTPRCPGPAVRARAAEVGFCFRSNLLFACSKDKTPDYVLPKGYHAFLPRSPFSKRYSGAIPFPRLIGFRETS